MKAASVANNKFHSGNGADGKHYWLTPPELMERIKAEFGQELFDPCPFPKAEDFNGLTCEWKRVNYLNVPFGSVIVEGKKVGMTGWARKAIVGAGAWKYVRHSLAHGRLVPHVTRGGSGNQELGGSEVARYRGRYAANRVFPKDTHVRFAWSQSE